MKHTLFVLLTATVTAIGFEIFYRLLPGMWLSNEPVAAFPARILATFILAALAWWGIISRPKRPTLKRGAVVGAFIGLLALPLSFVVTQILWMMQDVPAGGSQSEQMAYITGFGFIILLLTAIVTVPAGMFGGAMLAAFQSHITDMKV